MRWSRIACAVALLLMLASTMFTAADPSEKKAAAEVPATGKTDARFAGFDQLMTSFLQQHQLPGGALAVAKDGKIVYARGFGYADREKKEVVQPAALFRVASLSKPITAVAVLQL